MPKSSKSNFTLDELLSIHTHAAMDAKLLPADLAPSFARLADAANAAHAVLFRHQVQAAGKMPSAAALAELAPEGFFSAPEAEPDSEPEPPPAPDSEPGGSRLGWSKEDVERASGPVFRVRPKSARRRCSICEQPQWKGGSGWVCKNGHEGAPPLEDPET